MPLLTQYEDTSRYSAPPEPLRNHSDNEAFTLGRDDRRSGLCIGDNPFKADVNRDSWIEGWRHEDELMKQGL